MMHAFLRASSLYRESRRFKFFLMHNFHLFHQSYVLFPMSNCKCDSVTRYVHSKPCILIYAKFVDNFLRYNNECSSCKLMRFLYLTRSLIILFISLFFTMYRTIRISLRAKILFLVCTGVLSGGHPRQTLPPLSGSHVP